MKEIPLLLNGDMVRAEREGRKTQTRRPIKPQPDTSHWKPEYIDKPKEWRPMVQLGPVHHGYDPAQWVLHDKDSAVGSVGYTMRKNPLGCVGDLLWVRETWRCTGGGDLRNILYRAEGDTAMSYCGVDDGRTEILKVPEEHWAEWDRLVYETNTSCDWRPSIHMPKWVARTWLKVTGVRVERVQDISEGDAKAEGVAPENAACNCPGGAYKNGFCGLWDSIYPRPMPRRREGKIVHYESYPWEAGTEIREHKGLPWHVWGNPFVFATGFERI